MDILWAPWRINYVSVKKHKGCIFCDSLKALSKKTDKKKEYIVFRGIHSFCILNIFPYNNGHIMVSPKRHVKDLSYLSDAELFDLIKSVTRAKNLLEKVLRPEGYNIGINISKSAGAGIVGHLHIHIVPRWHGDTNFMPAVYNARVISQSLNELHKRLKSADVKPVSD